MTDDDNDNDPIMTETTHCVGKDRNNENNAYGCGDNGGGYLQYATGDDGVCNSFFSAPQKASRLLSCVLYVQTDAFSLEALTMHPLPRRWWLFKSLR